MTLLGGGVGGAETVGKRYGGLLTLLGGRLLGGRYGGPGGRGGGRGGGSVLFSSSRLVSAARRSRNLLFLDLPSFSEVFSICSTMRSAMMSAMSRLSVAAR